jgi:glycosyltransferase involved in cell wall biosynthesis
MDRLIRAFTRVHEEIDDATLILCGDGPLMSYLKYVSKKMGVSESVIFTGYTNNVGIYYSNCSVFVMTSRAEGFPNSMIEAMAYGCAIITLDSPGGTGEIIGKKNKAEGVDFCEFGINVPYVLGKAPRTTSLDEQELILGEAIIDLFRNDALLEHYKEKSYERAKDYEYNKIMVKWKNIIMEE